MTPTELFYDEDIFVEEIDFTTIERPDELPALQEDTVSLSATLRTVAAATIATVVTLGSGALPASSMSWSPASVSTGVVQPRPRLVDAGRLSNTHRAKADRAARLFKSVPLNDVERIPDPDYGL